MVVVGGSHLLTHGHIHPATKLGPATCVGSPPPGKPPRARSTSLRCFAWNALDPGKHLFFHGFSGLEPEVKSGDLIFVFRLSNVFLIGVCLRVQVLFLSVILGPWFCTSSRSLEHWGFFLEFSFDPFMKTSYFEFEWHESCLFKMSCITCPLWILFDHYIQTVYQTSLILPTQATGLLSKHITLRPYSKQTLKTSNAAPT